MNHIDAINTEIDAKKPYRDIIRKVFLTFPTHALVGFEDQQFEILDEIRSHFSVPIGSIHAVGSAKIGRSLHKNTPFQPGISDLDLAIVDSNLYLEFVEHVFRLTKGYGDRSGFTKRRGSSTANQYIEYTSKGIFRADLMPSDPKRAMWYEFFGNLSKKHTNLFRSISCCIYLSEVFYENKQISALRKHIEGRGI